MKKSQQQIIKNARSLRSNMTDAEQTLWQYLRMRQMHGLKFRRQHPCGHYILDFACLSHKLVIELDGGQHAEAIEKDKRRTAYLSQQGWKVIRFWNNQVLQEIDAVLAVIAKECELQMTQMKTAQA